MVAQDVYCREWPQGSFDWSPDGSKIIFSRLSSEDGNRGIWTVDTLNGGQQSLVSSPGGGQLIFPQYSPDGQWLRIYEPLYLEGLGVLRTWHDAGSGLLNWLELGGDIFPGFSSWSPDGSRLVFDEVTYLGFPGAGLYTAAPDGNGLQQILSRSNEAAERPSWSPRGDLIVFQLTSPVVSAYAGTRLGLIDPSGNGFRELYRSSQKLQAITWSAGGDTLLVGEGSEDSVQLLAFNVASGASQAVLTMGGWDISWSEMPLILDVVQDAQPVQVADFPYRDNLLLFLAPDYRLVLASPVDGKMVDLSQPMTVAGYSVSPSRQRVLTFGRLISIDFEDDGSLKVQQGTLPQQAGSQQIRWSPDEDQVAYQDRSGEIWIARLNGEAVKINGAARLPEWSADSRWLSYCDSQSNLWLVGSDRPAEIIANNTNCDQKWSQRESLLAFSIFSDAQQSSVSAHLFDPGSQTGENLLAAAKFHSWSPDGRLVALRQDNRQAKKYTIFIQDPVSGRQLALGQFEDAALGAADWMAVSEGYQFGPYRLSEDLRASSKIADAVFDSTPEGDRQVVAIGEREIVTLACISNGEAPQQLFTMGLSASSEKQAPSVRAQISPTGEWAAILTSNKDGILYQLTRCQDGWRIPLPYQPGYQAGEFSKDGAWFVHTLKGDVGAGRALIYDLSNGISRTITTVQGSSAYWLGRLSGVLAPANSMGRASGRLLGPQNIPLPGVEMYVDGRFAGVTDVSGRYLITGLGDGGHKIEPRLPDWTFEPATRTVRTPPDATDVNFEGIAPAVVQSSTRQDDIDVPEVSATQTPESVPFVQEKQLPEMIPWLMGVWEKVQSWGELAKENWPGIASGIRDLPLEVSLGISVMALLVLVLLTRRRRLIILSRTKAQPAGDVVAEIEDTQPTKVRQQIQMAEVEPEKKPTGDAVSTVEQMLNKGAEQVKQGDLEGGIASLRQLLEIEPENHRAWMWLGWAAVRQGDRRAAERFFRQAERLGHPKAREALEWLHK
jgi:Tol biopolymer transport system component